MFLRYFAFTWGALLATLSLFAVIVATQDWRPPESVEYTLRFQLVQAELRGVADTYGPARALSVWEALRVAHPQLDLVFNTDCSAEMRVAQTGPDCLSLVNLGPDLRVVPELRQFTPPLLLGALCSAIAAFFLSRMMTRPLRTVGQGLRELASGALETRIATKMRGSDREVRQLALAFDHAAERLQELTAGRERLFHDISHEIRSPLARLRVAVALLNRGAEDPVVTLAQMERDVARLDELVGAVLTLARLEGRDVQLTREPLDLRDVTDPIVDAARFEGRARGVTVRQSGDDLYPLTGDGELLHRAVENLLRNALKYSPEGGRIEVGHSRTEDRILLTVEDQGPGVPEDQLRQIFAPFVRVDHSGAQVSGAGLGLAIAARSVALHGGDIEAENIAGGGGLRIRLWLPRAK